MKNKWFYIVVILFVGIGIFLCNIEISEEKEGIQAMFIKINDRVLKVELEENSSVQGLVEKLKEGNITIEMSDYGKFEKVGSLGFNLPQNDEKITTVPGDIILYQGNSITIYYDTNTWNFTKLGKIVNISEKELRDILGDGNVIATFSLQE